MCRGRGILMKLLSKPQHEEKQLRRIMTAEARVRRAENNLFSGLDVKLEQYTEQEDGRNGEHRT